MSIALYNVSVLLFIFFSISSTFLLIASIFPDMSSVILLLYVSMADCIESFTILSSSLFVRYIDDSSIKSDVPFPGYWCSVYYFCCVVLCFFVDVFFTFVEFFVYTRVSGPWQASIWHFMCVFYIHKVLFYNMVVCFLLLLSSLFILVLVDRDRLAFDILCASFSFTKFCFITWSCFKFWKSKW